MNVYFLFFFFSSRRRHTRSDRDWSSDVCSSDLGVRILRWSDVSAAQQEVLRRSFTEQVFPLITPQALTRAPGHPFPLIPNLRLSLAAVVRDPHGGPPHFAYLKVPDSLPRFVPVAGGAGFVPLEEIIRENLSLVDPGLRVEAAHAFRVTRGAGLELDEHHGASLLQVIEEEAKRRPYGTVVRVEGDQAMPESVRDLLLRELLFEDPTPAAPRGPRDPH